MQDTPLFRAENLDDCGFFEILHAVRVSDIYSNICSSGLVLVSLLKVSVG